MTAPPLSGSFCLLLSSVCILTFPVRARASEGSCGATSVSVCLSNSAPLHSLFGFCQRSLTVTLVDSYCSSLLSSPRSARSQSSRCVGERTMGEWGREGVMGQPRLQQDPFSSAPATCVSRNVSVCVGCQLRRFLSSCLMTTLAARNRLRLPLPCLLLPATEAEAERRAQTLLCSV